MIDLVPSKKSDKIIRVGDRVRVINPEIFVRCGYPMDKEFAKNNLISPEDKVKLRNLLAGFGFQFSQPLSYGYSSDPRFEAIEEKIIDQIAFGILIRRGFGGPERKIITKRDEFRLNKVYEVSSKRYVKTGNRVSETVYGDEYEPAHLSNEKTHTVLSLYSCKSGKFEISSLNVEKLNKNYEQIEEDDELPF